MLYSFVSMMCTCMYSGPGMQEIFPVSLSIVYVFDDKSDDPEKKVAL